MERQREFEAVQYNLSILYQQFQVNINNGNYIRERDVQKQLSGDLDSGITADRDSQASSEITDLSNEEKRKEEANKENIEDVALASSGSTPSPSSSGEGADLAEVNSSEMSSPPGAIAKDKVSSWVDGSATRQFIKYSSAKNAGSRTGPNSYQGNNYTGWFFLMDHKAIS